MKSKGYSSKAKLTKRLIEETPAASGANVFIWDTEADRLALRITPSGHRSFIFQYTRNGRDRRMTLGQYGKQLTIHKARKKAEKMRLEVLNGGDPAQKKQETLKAPTVGMLRDEFLAHYISSQKLSTSLAYRCCWIHIAKHLGEGTLVSAVRWQHVAAMHRALGNTGKLTMANRVVAVLHASWELARNWEWIEKDASNPGRGHKRYAEQHRGAACTSEQLNSIGAAIRLEKGSIPSLAFTYAMLTGCRPGEATAMKWTDVDLRRRLWSLPAAKTGPRVVYLGQSAADLLASVPRMSEYVFSGRSGGHLLSLRVVWDRIQKRADLPPTLRIYDVVRHTFISAALELGIPLERVKRLAGHAIGSDITARYTHLKAETYLADADRVSAHLWAALQLEAPESSNVRAFPAAAHDCEPEPSFKVNRAKSK